MESSSRVVERTAYGSPQMNIRTQAGYYTTPKRPTLYENNLQYLTLRYLGQNTEKANGIGAVFPPLEFFSYSIFPLHFPRLGTNQLRGKRGTSNHEHKEIGGMMMSWGFQTKALVGSEKPRTHFGASSTKMVRLNVFRAE